MQQPNPCASTASGENITAVRDLLPFLLNVPVTYRFPKKNVSTPSNRVRLAARPPPRLQEKSWFLIAPPPRAQVSLDGFIADGGYSCACPAAASCGYHGKVLSALQFEKHAGAESKNQNGHIFLSNDTSLYSLFQELRDVPAEAFAEKFEAAAGVPLTMAARGIDYSDAVASDDGCSTQSSRDSAVGGMICLTDYMKESTSNSLSNLNWSASKRRSDRQFKRGGTKTSTPALSGSQDKGVPGLSTGTSKKNGTEDTHSESTAGPISINGVKPDSLEPAAIIAEYSKHDPANLALSLSSTVTIAQEPLPNCNTDPKSKESKTRDTTLHPLLFKEGGLPDNTLLIYKLRNGEALKQGYKRGTGIVCDCCNKEFTPSHFEDHAGMGRRRQPYHNIYTSEGVTLHKLALQLQDRLNPNGFGNANIYSFSDYPNLASGYGKEPSTTSVRIVPLKRTLQERVVETERCYICRDGHTTVGNIDSDTIVFCNQCERPCHIRCYNEGLAKSKVPLQILKEYMQFCFLCCEKCQVLRAHLDEELEKCEEIAFLRRIRSNICWRLLSGIDTSSDVQIYMPQVIDILRDAFAETAEHSGFFSDMVYSKHLEGDKDFRGMYCAVLTASTHVVSAAILKVRMEQVAELVLIATRSECRRKGYFVRLLNSIEAHLRAWNVNLLMAPVDPEMAPIWSEKLGFTILSDEEKKSMLEVHPLVMFENLLLVQKSLA